MKNLLITGGSGFIGKNLCEGLKDKYNIFAPNHNELDLLDFDGLKNYLQSNQINLIVHAAIHVPMFNGNEKEFFNNMQMFLNLEKISSTVEKIIYFGSGAEFDKRYDISMVEESDFGIMLPTTEYGLAKYTMTKLARNSANIYNLRLFGVFGKYELWEIKFISNLCCKAVFDLPLTIRKDCKFDFLYIDDLVKIVESMLENTPQYHDYNVCSGHPYSLLDLAKIVKRVSGKDISIELLSNETNLEYTASNSRLLNEFSSISITPMEEAIELLYDYYLSNREIIDYNILKESR